MIGGALAFDPVRPLTEPTDDELSHLSQVWSGLRYHLLLVDPRTFPSGQPRKGLYLPYDASSLPEDALRRLADDLKRIDPKLTPVLIHMGTRFRLKGLNSTLLVKGVDPSAYASMFGTPTLVSGNWLEEKSSKDEIILPEGLAGALNLSLGSSITMGFGLSAAERGELREFGLDPPNNTHSLTLVGLHNDTDGVAYVDRSVVDSLMRSEEPTYAAVRIPSPPDFPHIYEDLVPFFQNGSLFPIYRKVEMDSSPFAFNSPAGGIMVVWDSQRSGNREIWLGRLDESDGSLTDLEKVTNNSFLDDDPCGFYDGEELWVLFDSVRSGTNQVWATHRETGGNWARPIQLTSNDTVNIQPNILNAADGAWLVWVSYTNKTHSRIGVARLTDGGLAATTFISHNHTSIRNPCIGLNRDGDLVLYYSFIDIGFVGGEMVSKNGIASMTSPDGNEWSEPSVIMEGSVFDVQPSFLLDSSGESWLIWSSLRTTDRGGPTKWPNPEIWYKHTIDGEVWSPPRQLTDSWGADFEPCLVQASDGRIWALWYSEDGNPFGRIVLSVQQEAVPQSNPSPMLGPAETFLIITVVLMVVISLLVRTSPPKRIT